MTHLILNKSLRSITCLAVVMMATPLAASPVKPYAQAFASRPQIQNDAQAKVMAEAQRLIVQALQLSQEKRYDEALPLTERALILLEKEFGPEHRSLMVPMINLASLLLEKKDPTHAGRLAQRALTLIDKISDASLEEAQMRFNLAMIFRALDSLKQAERLYRQARELLEKHLGPEDLQVGATLIGLAELALQRKEYTRAEPLYLRAVSIAETRLGAEHPQTAQTLRLLADLYRQQNRFDRAEPLFHRVLAILEESFGVEHPNLILSLNDLGLLYAGAKQYGQAISYFQRALKIVERAFGPEDVNIINVLNSLADLYYRQGEPEEALQTGQRALAIAEKVNGTQHSSVETLRKNIALFKAALRESKPAPKLRDDRSPAAEKGPSSPIFVDAAGRRSTVYPLMEENIKDPGFDLQIARQQLQTINLYLANKYDEAIVSGKVWLAIAEKKSTKSSYAALAHLVLGEIYLAKGEIRQAESFLQQSLSILEKTMGKESQYVIEPLIAIGRLHIMKGDFTQAEALFQRALTLSEKHTRAVPSLLPQVLIYLARLHKIRGNYKKAEQIYQHAVSICEQTGNNGLLPDILLDLTNLYMVLGEFGQAESLIKRVVNLGEQDKNRNHYHSSMALYLRTLGEFYERIGNYQQAELSYQRAIALIERTLEAEGGLIDLLPALANLYSNYGQYEKAEIHFRRAEELTAKLLGPQHQEMAWILANHASLAMDSGNYLEAEALQRRSLAIFENVYGAEHVDYVALLATLGRFYEKRGDYSQAEQLYQSALVKTEKTLGAEHPNVAVHLNDLGSVYAARKEYDRATLTLQRALALKEKAFGQDSPNLASTLSNLASLYLDRKAYDQAAVLYSRAIILRENAYGKESEFTILGQHGLAKLYRLKGDLAKAEPLYRQIVNYVEKKFSTQDPRKAALLNDYAYLCLAKGDLAQATNLLVRSNEMDEELIRLNLGGGSENQKQLFLATFAHHLNDMVMLHMRYAPDDAQAARLAVTAILRNKGRTLDVMTNSLGVLRQRLNPQDRVLLDQLTKARSQLSSLVLRGPGADTVERYQAEIKRFEGQIGQLEAEITARSARLQKSGSSVSLAGIQAALPPGAKLVEFILYRPESHDAASTPRYVSYVIGAQGDPSWVELGEAPAINQLVATLRDALRNPQKADVKAAARALDEKIMQPVRKLLGPSRTVLLSPDGALYLVPFAALVDEQQRYLVEQYSFSYLTSGRDLLRLQTRLPSQQQPLLIANPDFGERTQESGADAQPVYDPLGLANAVFTPLPGTADETEALRALLPQATVLAREQATEGKLKQVAAPSILHIATHGFFLDDVNIEPTSAVVERLLLQQVSPDRKQRPDYGLINPLLRSGLGLAAANVRKSGDDDGILTAFEAAALNLLGTRLVVLSACDTGIGEVKNGDGVYGLRRALVLAGSETQVMSLWPVSDKGTSDLMTEYYKALLAGQGRGEAMRQVQLKMLGNQERQHPYYWASFIVSGEWANLDGKR